MESKLDAVDLFAGIGGMSLALSDLVNTVAYVEIDPFAQRVLLSRMKSRDLDVAPIYNDIKKINGDEFKNVDIILAGFPCQDISCAGARKGLAGERSGLFYEVIRLAKNIKPKFIFLENVASIRTNGLQTIVEALSEIGYDSRWCTVSAASVGAPHKRNRWFLLAYSNSKPGKQTYSASKPVALKRKARMGFARQNRLSISSSYWEKDQSSVLRVDDGAPDWVDRNRCLGNAVVPQQARFAFDVLLKGKQQ